MENEVIYFCGNYPENFKKTSIKSNENFIFEADTLFKPRVLFDVEKNNVTVNSFIECEHYVTGGWNYNPVKELELLLQNSLSILFFAFGVVVFILALKKLKTK